jgi:hypothetical protein
VSLGLVKIVGNAPIPERYREFPLFKAENTNYLTGKRTWWLWDGEHETRIGDLTEEYYELPICEIISHPVLIERILSSWTSREEI